MRKLLPFALTAAVSSAFSYWLAIDNAAEIRILRAEFTIAKAQREHTDERLDKVVFTKAGDFRYPDLRVDASNGALVYAESKP